MKMYQTRVEAEAACQQLMGWPHARVVEIEPVIAAEVEDGLYAIELTPHRQDGANEVPATYLGSSGYQE